MNRIINSRRLKKLIRSQAPNAMAKVSVGAEVGISTLQKMIDGKYPYLPKPDLRDRLCTFFNVSEDDLFPFEEEEAS